MIRYPVSKPSLSDKEMTYVREALATGWISSKGKFVQNFEDTFAHFNEMKYGVACSSGTTALTLAIAALGIGEGDEVIVPEFTMIASAWAVSYNGAKPIFVDCSDDLLIDVDLIEAAITKRTKAIMPVHIYGRQCNMREINRLAYEYNLAVIEDSCEAHGVKPEGTVACFSLFANKIISSGEGGICVTNDLHLARQMRHLANMAFDVDHSFLHKKLGFNFRMTNLQAAVALGQAERISEILMKRRTIETWYNELIPEDYHMPRRQVLWMYDINCRDKQEEIRKSLAAEGIETRVFFKPMSMQPMYRSADYQRLCAYKWSRRGIYLPTFTDMTRNDIVEIAKYL